MSLTMTQLPSVSELMINTAKPDTSPSSSDTKPSPRSPSTVPRIASSSSFSSKYNYSSSPRHNSAALPPPPPLRRLTEPSIIYNKPPVTGTGASNAAIAAKLHNPYPQPRGATSAPGHPSQGTDYFNHSHHPNPALHPNNYQLNPRLSTSSSIDPLTREPSTNGTTLSPSASKNPHHPSHPLSHQHQHLQGPGSGAGPSIASSQNLPPAPQYPQHTHSQGTSPTSGPSYPMESYPHQYRQAQGPPQGLQGGPHQGAPPPPATHEMNPPPGYPYYYPVAAGPMFGQPDLHQDHLYSQHQAQAAQQHQAQQQHQQHQPYMYQLQPGQIPPPGPPGGPGAPGHHLQGLQGPPYYHGVPHRMMDNGVAMVGVGMPLGPGGLYEENNALINKRRIIKRRTRTGCLTCRKRRIKCDERKPTCFNCERSKKVCLGYEKLNGIGNKKRRDTSLDLHPDPNYDHDPDHDHDHDLEDHYSDDRRSSASQDDRDSLPNGTGDHSNGKLSYPTQLHHPEESKVSVYNLVKRE